MRRLRALLRVGFRSDPRMAILAFVFVVIGGASGPLVGLWLKSMVDAAGSGNEGSAVAAAVGLSVFWIVSIVASQYSEHVQWGLHVHIIRLIDSDLIDLGGRVPTIEMHERPDVADRVELLQQGALYFAFAMTSVVWAVGVLVQLATTILVLMSVSPWLILLPLLGVPSLIAGGSAQKTRQRAWEETIEDQRLSEHLLELGTTPGPGKEVRIFGLGGEIARRHAALRGEMLARERRAEWRGAVLTTVGWLVFAIGFAGAIVLVTSRAIDGRATVGDVLLVIALAGQIQTALNGAYWLIGDFVGTLRSADHYLWVGDFVDRAMQRRRSADTPPPDRFVEGIRFEAVSFRYPETDTDVLQDIDLTIPSGTTVAVVGLNGAGKTTLAKLLAGFYEPSAGRITVDGIDVRDLDAEQWRRRLSACFQDFVHFQYLAGESVGLGDLPRIEDEAWVSGALQRAGATDVIEHLPEGLGTLLGRAYGDGVELSTGEWQKVALGRAMMRDEPLLLILDEPTASLDAYAEHALFERYAAASDRTGRDRGAIMVLISHRFSTVRMADLVVVMEDGRVVQTGTHAELEREDGAYRELYELQSRAYR
jgi:ATP-binding cassette, subfamily B, bacterial